MTDQLIFLYHVYILNYVYRTACDRGSRKNMVGPVMVLLSMCLEGKLNMVKNGYHSTFNQHEIWRYSTMLNSGK